mgnify:CR=1 FL=1
MKKFFLFAASAVALTVSCQKLQELVNPGTEPVDDTNPVEIKFTTNVATVETKAGTGALDALSANQTLYIYGLNRTNPAKRPIINAPAQAIVAASAASVDVQWLDASLEVDPTIAYFYNGTNDMYDFYGYYVGDAAGANPAPDETNYTLDVTIDGQHDILLAKAEGDAVAETYSAKTARAGVKPNLAFEHQLSQFIFKVRNHGNSEIVLTDVDINTLTKGTLTVAETTRGGTSQGLEPVPSTNGDLSLPMTTGENLPAKPNASTESAWVDLDGSVMVFPEQAKYDIKLTLTQNGVTGAREVTVPFTYASGIKAGSAYTLSITVYSLTEAGVTASLTAWTPVDVDAIDTENYPGVVDGDGEETPAPTFTINKNAEPVAVGGGSFEVTVTKTDDAATVSAVPSESWVTVTNVGDVYTLAVEENLTGAERTATVTFSDGDETTHTVAITQAGA